MSFCKRRLQAVVPIRHICGGGNDQFSEGSNVGIYHYRGDTDVHPRPVVACPGSYSFRLGGRLCGKVDFSTG